MSHSSTSFFEINIILKEQRIQMWFFSPLILVLLKYLNIYLINQLVYMTQSYTPFFFFLYLEYIN